MPGQPSTTVVLWLTFVVLLASPVHSYDQYRNDLEQQVFLALNRVLNFYHRDYKSVNLDGIFGLRVAQGAFLSVLNDVQAGQLKVDERLLGQVKDLYNKASLIGQRALPFLKRSTPDYFEKFRKQVSNPWANFKPFTNKELLIKRNYDPQKRRNVISFDEETSDQCMSGLTGTGSNSHITQPCQVSDKCWGVISAEGAEGYALTHQALFFLLGETQGCTPQLLKRLEQSHITGGLEQIYNRICSDMYPQMIALEGKGRPQQLDSYDRDLYMEQAMVCGSIGYHHFLSSERLRNILTWQRKDGCFGEKKEVSEEDDKQDSDIDGKTVGIGMKVKAPFDDIKQSLEDEYSQVLRKPLSVSMRTMRSLLVEKELNDGCLSHLTGVATGVLGVYLRWLLYPKDEQLFQKQEKVEVKASEGLGHNTNIEVYKTGNLADVIAQKEKQLQRQQSMKKNNVMQTAHLRQMRRAAMLRNNAQELLRREGSGSFPWGVVVLGTCSIFLVLSMMWIKGFKGTLNVLKTASRAKKSTHVI